ncbi:MAG: hypothetical protein IPJ82_13700 [Lewinellaceae bacterium]|nr:hypothetical protein [Lewinellaceae bacterium]
MSVKDLPVGITRFTLLDENKAEQAERLAFVNRDRGLKIELRPDKEKYLPREQVKNENSRQRPCRAACAGPILAGGCR